MKVPPFSEYVSALVTSSGPVCLFPTEDETVSYPLRHSLTLWTIGWSARESQVLSVHDVESPYEGLPKLPRLSQ